MKTNKFFQHYLDDDFDIPEPPGENCRCKFLIGENSMCNKTKPSSAQYCTEHTKEKCYCAGQATHYCIKTIKCKKPLCDGYYCNVFHNETYHKGSFFNF